MSTFAVEHTRVPARDPRSWAQAAYRGERPWTCRAFGAGGRGRSPAKPSELLHPARHHVAARGLDLPGVSHVFNLDVPTQSMAYLHRVGRTCRAGAKGTAVTVMIESETRLVPHYESELRITFTRVRLREGRLATVTETAPQD